MSNEVFEYRTAAPIDVVAQRLQTLERPRRGFLKALKREVTITPRSDDELEFEIRTLRRGRGFNITSVRSVGVLTVDPVTRETITRGEVKIDVSMSARLVLWA